MSLGQAVVRKNDGTTAVKPFALSTFVPSRRETIGTSSGVPLSARGAALSGSTPSLGGGRRSFPGDASVGSASGMPSGVGASASGFGMDESAVSPSSSLQHLRSIADTAPLMFVDVNIAPEVRRLIAAGTDTAV